MEVSILQWNVWFKQDIRNILELLREQSADVVCLQELTHQFSGQFANDTPKYLADALGYNYVEKQLPIESTDGQTTILANAIFSRFPIISSNWQWINEPKSGGGYDDEFRPYVEATLDLGKTRLTIGTTHMSYTKAFGETTNKSRETDRLTKILATKANNFVFAGDLNALPGSYTIREIGELLKSIGPDYGQKTWTTKPFSYQGFKAETLDWRLDYLFASNDVGVVSSEIVGTKFSDHLPLRATIRVI